MIIYYLKTSIIKPIFFCTRYILADSSQRFNVLIILSSGAYCYLYVEFIYFSFTYKRRTCIFVSKHNNSQVQKFIVHLK